MKDFVLAENELNKLNTVVQLAHELKRIFYVPACKKLAERQYIFHSPCVKQNHCADASIPRQHKSLT